MRFYNFFRYRWQIVELERELSELKARAERAEQLWSERQIKIMELSVALQKEKSRISREERSIIGQMIQLLQKASKRLTAAEGVSIQPFFGNDENGKMYICKTVVAISAITIIEAFAAMVHTDKETLLAKLGGAEILEKINEGLIPPAVFKDEYKDIGGKLFHDSDVGMCCGRCKEGKDEAKK